MRGISRLKGASNQQTPTKKKPKKWTSLKRKVRNIRRYIMDAFRNARSIVEINKKVQALENKLNNSLKTSNELEVKHRKSINFKLLLLLSLWILDKVVLFIFFRFFNG